MGGNTKAINRSTGETLYFAEKINMQNITKTFLKSVLVKLLNDLNDIFYSERNYFLWSKKSVINNGEVFSGSAAFLFDQNISNEEFLKYKPLIGDIDILIQREQLKYLFDILANRENMRISNSDSYYIAYVGQNRQNLVTSQINSIFKYCSKEYTVLFQVDFVGSDFENSYPTEFTKFSHNSEWSDVKKDIKGVMHKFLIRSITRAVSERPDILILTPKSSFDPNDKKFRVKKMNTLPFLFSFSVDRGLRGKYRISNMKFDNKFLCKELETSESKYITDVSKIFNVLFMIDPDKDDLKKFKSFEGLLSLIEKHFSKDDITKIFLYLLDICFDISAQQLSRGSWEEDLRTKMVAIYRMINNFSYLLNVFDNQMKQKVKDYYKLYKKI